MQSKHKKDEVHPLGRMTLVEDGHREVFEDIEVRQVEHQEEFKTILILTNGS